jgi:hypothetical protein
MRKTITISRPLVEVKLFGLPSSDTFSLTDKTLKAFNAGKTLSNEAAQRWLHSLRGGRPVAWSDIDAVLS